MSLSLFHFSHEGDIAEFNPRPPLRHPDAEPLVYAIDAWHSPLYLFPRDCPRIGLWPLPPDEPMRLLIDRAHEHAWRTSGLYRYSMPTDGFVDAKDHGVWVSRGIIRPTCVEFIPDLPGEVAKHTIEVEIVDDLVERAKDFYDFSNGQFRIDPELLHISMIRMSLLPSWPNSEPGEPVGMPPNG